MDEQIKFLNKWSFSPSVIKIFSMILMALLFLSQFVACDIGGFKIGIIDSGFPLFFFIICGYKGLSMRLVVLSSLIFCATMLLTSIYNISIGIAGIHSILLCARLFLIFLIMGAANWVNHNNPFEPKSYIYSVFWGLVIACVIGIVTFYLNITIAKDQQIMWFNDGSYRIRAGGSIGNTGAFGYQIFLLYSISLLLLLFSKKNKWSYLFLFPMTLSVFSLVISSSRGSLLGILVFTIILLTLVNRKDKKTIIVMLFLSFLSASFCSFCFLDTKTLEYTAQRVGILNESDDSVLQEGVGDYNKNDGVAKNDMEDNYIDSFHAEKSDAISSFNRTDYFNNEKNNGNKFGVENRVEKNSIASNFSSGRLPAWKKYLLAMKEHVVWGVGYKNSLSYYGVLIDNSFISVFVEGGAGVFLLFLLIWIGAIYHAVKIYNNEKSKGAFLIAFIMSTMFQGVFLDIYSQWISFPFFIFLIFVISSDNWEAKKI